MKDNFFASATMQLFRLPLRLNPESQISEEGPWLDDAVAAAHAFFHEHHGIPITWMMADDLIEHYAERFNRWKHEYGDSVGIYEGIVYNPKFAGEYYTWPQKAGMDYKAIFGDKIETEESRLFYQLNCEQQEQAIAYLKQRFDRAFSQQTRIFSVALGNEDTIRIMAKLGLDIAWGYCWGHYGDNINHYGVPWHPFYVSENNFRAPNPGNGGVLGVHWSVYEPHNIYLSSHWCREGVARFMLQPCENANRSFMSDTDYHRRLIRQWAGQAKHNPCVYMPFQLEGIWMDTTEDAWGHFPDFNKRSRKVFFEMTDEALACGARMVSVEQFADCFRQEFKKTPENILYMKDIAEGLRVHGKDRDYGSGLFYGSRDKQWLFFKDYGFNPVQRHDYTQQIRTGSDEGYPFDLSPKVMLSSEPWFSTRMGVWIDESKYWGAEVVYKLYFHVKSYGPQPDYGFVIWQMNLPSYIDIKDLVKSEAVKDMRLLREEDTALIFAALKDGNNDCSLTSSLPTKYIRIARKYRHGDRYYVEIENTGPLARVCNVVVKIDPMLKLRGYYWNRDYQSSLARRGGSSLYNFQTGLLSIHCVYPAYLDLPTGKTELVIEVAGEIGQ